MFYVPNKISPLLQLYFDDKTNERSAATRSILDHFSDEVRQIQKTSNNSLSTKCWRFIQFHFSSWNDQHQASWNDCKKKLEEFKKKWNPWRLSRSIEEVCGHRGICQYNQRRDGRARQARTSKQLCRNFWSWKGSKRQVKTFSALGYPFFSSQTCNAWWKGSSNLFEFCASKREYFLQFLGQHHSAVASRACQCSHWSNKSLQYNKDWWYNQREDNKTFEEDFLVWRSICTRERLEAKVLLYFTGTFWGLSKLIDSWCLQRARGSRSPRSKQT